MQKYKDHGKTIKFVKSSCAIAKSKINNLLRMSGRHSSTSRTHSLTRHNTLMCSFFFKDIVQYIGLSDYLVIILVISYFSMIFM